MLHSDIKEARESGGGIGRSLFTLEHIHCPKCGAFMKSIRLPCSHCNTRAINYKARALLGFLIVGGFIVLSALFYFFLEHL